MEINTIISIIAIVFSLIATIITMLNYYKDRAKLIVDFSLMSDKTNKKFIRYRVFNIGRRSTTIKNFGSISWTLGDYSCRGGQEQYFTINEKGSVTYDEEYNDDSFLVNIKYFAVQDVTGKIWKTSSSSMEFLYSHVYSINPRNGWESFCKKMYRKRKRSLLSYLKFIRKYNLNNKLKNRIGFMAGDEFMSDEILNEFVDKEDDLELYRIFKERYKNKKNK